ncbi:MAG: amino acid--tRNA ligase-related protein, partial [bacterium]|nr:amino acid--tRNA ligase-related protein [bacterium]
RNEGIDVTHYPEFTMIEFYESYSNATLQMEFVERLLKDLAKKLFKKTSLIFNGNTIELGKLFKRISYFSALAQYALFPKIHEASHGELFLKAQQLGVPSKEGDSREKILDDIFKKACRPKIIQPTFIVDYPIHMLPLAKKKEGSDTLVDAFQLVVGGIELSKGFSELNDPIDQRERFLEQEKNIGKGDREAQKIDEDFLEALEYGMPPAGGVGIGIDRLAMLLTDAHNIKDVILFPTMRRKE